LIVLSGCGLTPAASNAPDSTLPPIPPVASTPPAVGAAVALDRADTGWIDSCVRYVQRGAFVGDAELSALWIAADQDDTMIRMLCEGLPGPDFAALRDIPLAAISRLSSGR
jgi:hypothetical protein